MVGDLAKVGFMLGVRFTVDMLNTKSKPKYLAFNTDYVEIEQQIQINDMNYQIRKIGGNKLEQS
jgi:hypothetical protein